MLLTKTTDRRRLYVRLLKPLLYLAGLYLLLDFVVYPSYLIWLTKEDATEGVFYCDMEHHWKKQIISGGQYFDKAQTLSKEMARSGQSSSKLPKSETAQYGVGYKLAVQGNEQYQVEAWMSSKQLKENGALAVSDDGRGVMNWRTSTVKEKDKAGWGRLEINFSVPDYIEKDTLLVFLLSEGKEAVYFDDFKIQKLPSTAELDTSAVFKAAHFEMNIKDKNYQKLQRKRDQAFKDGILISDEDSWIKASLEEDGKTYPIKTRLKGDWLDHLRSKKWSFRIELKEPNAWNGLTTFSMHQPSARYYLWEWVIHKLWEREDVLTTRYDFATLSLNGKSLGVYAWEEHFVKQLLESKNRREGPIVRFTEDAMWDFRYKTIQTTGSYNQQFLHPSAYAKNAEVRAFKEKKTLSNPSLKEQYRIAQDLMHQYQVGLVPPETIFDLDRLAKFFAIADVMAAWHCTVWHNIRYYYNPVTSKLEPIGFDAFTNKPGNPLLLARATKRGKPGSEAYMRQNLFFNDVFLEKYIYHMMRIGEKGYLEDFANEIQPGLEERLELLQKEFPFFKMNIKDIKKRHKFVRNSMMPYQEHSVKVEWIKTDNKKVKSLKLRNLHLMPLKVIGYGESNQRPDQRLENTNFLLPAPNAKDTLYQLLDVPSETQYVFYQMPGIDSIFSSSIPKLPLSNKLTPFQYLLDGKKLKSNPIYRVDTLKKIVRFEKGKHVLRSRIVIPAGYKVYFDPGVEIDFSGTTFFLSQSPVYVQGTAEEPVIFRGTEKKARGFTVLQSPQKSKLEYLQVEGFNTLDIDGWKLTGAVTFYESDVDISHCIFKDNLCEDGVNVIRSKVTFDKSKIVGTFSDGLDLDFCQGAIRNSVFEETGNDGVDLSGSQMEIDNCQFMEVGDKGISVGENSQVHVGYVQVTGAVIGVASKDYSELKIDQIDLKNCNQGFAAYQKKPEFGPANIKVVKHTADNIRYLYTIAPNCRLDLEGKIIEGEDYQ